MRVSLDGTKLEPGLATEWKAADDGLSWTFTLRDGVKFSDGKDLTAEDVKASLDAARGSEKSSWASNYAAIKDIEIVDPKTIKINLTGPYAALPSVMALFAAGILPADLVAGQRSRGFRSRDRVEDARHGRVHGRRLEQGRADRHEGQPELLEGQAGCRRGRHHLRA